MARKIYLRGGTGIGAFTKIYGGSQNNGSRPSHFVRASRGLHRHILMQLETAELVGRKKNRK